MSEASPEVIQEVASALRERGRYLVVTAKKGTNETVYWYTGSALPEPEEWYTTPELALAASLKEPYSTGNA